MTISGDYAQPVQVNGYTCRNCTDVDLAKKHIDPAHPASGPFDVNAMNDPSRRKDPAVKIGGAIASAASDATRTAQQSYQPGQNLDLRV